MCVGGGGRFGRVVDHRINVNVCLSRAQLLCLCGSVVGCKALCRLLRNLQPQGLSLGGWRMACLTACCWVLSFWRSGSNDDLECCIHVLCANHPLVRVFKGRVLAVLAILRTTGCCSCAAQTHMLFVV